MSLWWESLGAVGKIFAVVAIPSTVVLLLQTLLMLLGIGGHGGDASDGAPDAAGDADIDGDAHDGLFGSHAADGDADTDADGDVNETGGLHWLTMRGIIAFLTVFGWVGILCVRQQLPLPLTVLLSVTAGVVAMVVVAVLFRLIYSLQSDGTENIRHAVGETGTVYLRIPESRKGTGKVNLLLDGALVEKEAVTDEESSIAYGEQVLVVGISGGNTLIVRKKM